MNYSKYAIIDLHFHLDGSLSPQIVIKMAKEERIKLPTYCPRKLKKYLSVPKECRSLNEYLEKFALPNLVLQSKNSIYKCTLDVLKRQVKQGIKYIEIRMAPQLSTAQGLTQKEVVETLIKACHDGEKFGIFSNLILCMMRGDKTKEANIATIEVAKDFLEKGVVALDLAGAEALFPNKMFEKEFELINKYKIPFTIHAGEADGAKSVESALEFKPVRIGHGIHSADDEKTLDLLKKSVICLEICPKSNIDTKTIKSYSELPLQKFREFGIKFCINTDDSTVSNTTLKKEFKTLVKLGYKENDLREFVVNAIEASFASKNIKDNLLSYIEKI